jgi:hypothetical protein
MDDFRQNISELPPNHLPPRSLELDPSESTPNQIQSEEYEDLVIAQREIAEENLRLQSETELVQRMYEKIRFTKKQVEKDKV